MTENTKKNPAKDLLIGLFVSIFSFLLVIFIFEIGLKLIGFSTKHLFPKEFISKDGHFHSLAPDVDGRHTLAEFDISFKTNSIGLRDKEYPHKSTETLRMLVLGDSFTMGWGVEQDEVFMEVFEKKINEDKIFDCNIEVLNAGVYGYGTVDELLFLQKMGLKLKPDIILLTFFIGNDIFENLDAYRKFFDRKKSEYPIKKSFSIWCVRFIREHSSLYNFLMARLRNMKVFRSFYNKQTLLFNAGEPRDEIELYEKSRQESISDYWKVTKDIILKIKRLCDENQIKLILMTIPSKVQVYNEQWTEISKKLEISEDSDIELPDKILEKLCIDNGIYFYPLLDQLQASGIENKDLYFKLDRHWKPYCHKIVGNYLYDYLTNKKIIFCPTIKNN